MPNVTLALAPTAVAALDRARSGGGELGVLFNRRPARGEGSQIDAQMRRQTDNFDLLAVLQEDREAFARSVKEREPVHYVAPALAFVRGLGIYLDLLSGSGALEETPAPVRALRA